MCIFVLFASFRRQSKLRQVW